MKQIIRLTESDLRRLVAEAANEMLGFGYDERNEYRPSDRGPAKRDGFGLGNTSANSGISNMELFDDISKGKFWDRLKGAWAGFKQGRDSMDRTADVARPYQDSADRVHAKMNATKGSAQNMVKAHGLARDLGNTVKNDVKSYEMNNKQVDQAVEMLGNDIERRPEAFGLQRQAAPEAAPEYSAVSEAVNRAIRKYLK